MNIRLLDIQKSLFPRVSVKQLTNNYVQFNDNS